MNFYKEEDLTHSSLCFAAKGDELLQGRGPHSLQPEAGECQHTEMLAGMLGQEPLQQQAPAGGSI